VTAPRAQFPIKGLGYGQVDEPTPRVLTPFWAAVALGAGSVGALVSIAVLGVFSVCVGTGIGLAVAGARFRMVGGYDQRVVPRIWIRPDGLDLAVLGRYAVTYRFVPWSEVVEFGFEAADAIWQTGPQAYVDLVLDDAVTRVRIGVVSPDFPAAVRHYSNGAHEVTWPIA
jgi:hypothetical protein